MLGTFSFELWFKSYRCFTVVSEPTLAVSRHIRAEVRGHEHGRVGAQMPRHVDGRVRGTDVAHGTVSTRRMGRGQERRSWYLGWSGTRRGRRVLRGMIVTAQGNSVGPVL